jgi:small GTP-binding protein
MTLTKPDEPTFKVIVIGDSGVGKSAVTIRFCDNTFFTEGAPTLGIDFKYARATTLDADNPREAKLQVWDTAGQETFLTLTTGFYRSCSGVLLCFDLTSRTSFENLDRWLARVKEHATADVPVVLVGCKLDLAAPVHATLTLGSAYSTFRQVESSEGEAYARDHKCVCYFETSAKDNTNVEHVFRHLATYLMAKALPTVPSSAIAGKPEMRASRRIEAPPGPNGADAKDSGCPC